MYLLYRLFVKGCVNCGIIFLFSTIIIQKQTDISSILSGLNSRTFSALQSNNILIKTKICNQIHIHVYINIQGQVITEHVNNFFGGGGM